MLPLWNLILGWLLTALILVGNGLVVFLITTRRYRRTPANCFVLSLAVADFGVGAFYYPRYSICKMYPHICQNNAARVSFCVTIFFLCASMTSLCMLTLDRYLAIVKPMRYVTSMTRKRCALLIVAAWSVPIPVLISCLAWTFVEPKDTRNVIAKCFWICLGVLNLFACAFLFFATAKIVLIVRRIARRNAILEAQLNFNYRAQRCRAFKTREAASAKMIGMVVAFFVVCYLIDTSLTLILRVLLHFPNRKATINAILVLTRFLKLTNSAVNPVSYTFYKKEIWRELRRSGCSTVERQQVPSYGLDVIHNHVTDF